MQKLPLTLTLLFVFQLSRAQDQSKRSELGSTLVTVNSFYKDNFGPFGRKPLEFMNGLFYRYTKNRIAIRALVAYSETTILYDLPISYRTAYVEERKDIRLGLGGQYAFLKNKDWIYTYLDLAYRNVYSIQRYYGELFPQSYSWVRNSNGLDCSLGIGLKLKVFRNIYLSPECGFYSSTESVKNTYTYLPSQITKFNRIETNITTVCKLHCTVKF